MEVPIGRSYPRSWLTNYREPIGSNYRYHYRGVPNSTWMGVPNST
jgi:hypothetical protein